MILVLLTLACVSGLSYGVCPSSSSWKRTRILIQKPQETGYHMFIRGGKGGTTVPIKPETSGAPSCCSADYMAWQSNDCALDWSGHQAGQGYWNHPMYGNIEAKGTPAYVTTNQVGHPQYSQHNLYGADYWMADFYMDCSKVYANDWFMVQGIWNNIGGSWAVIAEDPSAQQGACQPGQPDVTGFGWQNLHWAKCGYDNHFKWGQNWCSIVAPGVTPPSPSTPPPSSDFQCGDYANPLAISAQIAAYDGIIVGGYESNVNGWPWQLSFQVLSSSSWLHYCGASLIRVSESQEETDIAVIAAHCLGLTSRVIAGDHDLTVSEGNEQISYVSFGIQHPNYNIPYRLHNDIAIIKLATPIQFRHGARPVCVAKESPPVGKKCYTTGWGRLYENGPNPDKLQELVLPIVSTCQILYYDPNSQVCAGFYGQEGQGACNGDSGGPLACEDANSGKFYLAGVTSFKVGNCASINPGGWARVSSFCSWIYQQVCNYSGIPGSGSSSYCPLISQLCE